MELSDSGDLICIKTRSGEMIGKAELSLIEDDNGEHYRLTWMFLDLLDGSYRRQGLGRAALVFHRDTFNLPIEVADDDGRVRSDGSHLTGDAPGFAAEMVKEGLLFRLAWSTSCPF